jgi:hypothetical protein
MMRWNGPIVFMLAALVLFSALPFALAEGSRNLMPSGADRNRTYLRDALFAPGGIRSQSTFFVFARSSEVINLARAPTASGLGASVTVPRRAALLASVPLLKLLVWSPDVYITAPKSWLAPPPTPTAMSPAR